VVVLLLVAAKLVAAVLAHFMELAVLVVLLQVLHLPQGVVEVGWAALVAHVVLISGALGAVAQALETTAALQVQLPLAAVVVELLGLEAEEVQAQL